MQEPVTDITLDLVRCPKCGLQLDAGVPVCPNDGTRVLQTPEIGALFQNKYVFVERLAAGGMGVVYKAKQEGLDRYVAIKVMSIANVTANSVRRFQQEAQALAMLHHPRLVQVHELGVTPYGQPYTVMEYVDGKGLDHVLSERKTISLTKALHVFMQVCDGLIYVHDSGILHRDLKPSNIMLINPFDEHPTVKLVDFGIAKIMDSNSQKGLTQTGEVMGSPLYMSPEQAKGLPVDARSDIYSLGCVMYEALTGAAPFQGGSVVEIILKQVSGKHRPINSVVRGYKYPNILETIVNKMLEKEPDDRYSSVAELRDDLGKLDSENRIWYHVPISALQRSKQDPVILFAVLALTTLAVVGCALMLWNVLSAKQHEAHFGNDTTDVNKDLFEGPGASLFAESAPSKVPAKKNKELALAKMPAPSQIGGSAPDALGGESAGERNMISPRWRIVDSSDEKVDLQGLPLPPHAFRWFNDRKNRYITAVIVDKHCLVDDESIQYIKGFPLLELRLIETNATRASIPDIAKIRTLEELQLEGIKLTAADCRQLTNLKQLRELQLAKCDLTDDNVRILVSGLHGLRKIDISQNAKIDNGALAAIAQNEPSLNFLDIGDTAVSDRGIQLLTGLPYLQVLYIDGTAVSDKCFSSLERLRSLRLLDLRRCAVDDDGLANFKAVDLSGLRMGTHTHVTNVGMQRFATKNSECSIVLRD